jgi:hypothetical protein
MKEALHGVTSQKTPFFMVTAVKTSNLMQDTATSAVLLALGHHAVQQGGIISEESTASIIRSSTASCLENGGRTFKMLVHTRAMLIQRYSTKSHQYFYCKKTL